MECVWRRRTPELVRSLLLTEPQMSTDEEPPSSSSSAASTSSVRVCGLCLSESAQYTCPRCNVPYCSLSCYRSSVHAVCSEQFYKECVSEELRQHGRAEHQDRIHMRDVLLRLRRAEGGMDRVMRELVESSGGRVTERDTETLILLSRLAEIQTDREKGRGDEVQDILQRLGQIDGDEEEEEEDVVTSLAGLNVEDLDEVQLWNLLPVKDRQRFKQLLKDGAIGALVPVWRPWWEEHERDAAAQIEELQQEKHAEHSDSSEEGAQSHAHQWDMPSEPPSLRKQEVQEKKMKECKNAPPPISFKIPPLSSLCSASPSPLVKFSLVNVLYVYAFTLRFFNGDVCETQQLLEFAQLVLCVCECLGRGRTFGSFSEALSAAMTSVSEHHHPRDSVLSAVEAMAHILSGASEVDRTGYTLSALAHLRSLFGRARITAPRDHAHFRRMCFLAAKKCEFLQAWVDENTQVLRALARQAWSESQRQTAERQVMETDRKQVEKDRMKKTASGKVLIEEM
ncbi:Zinc finger HIT domain-containing protein 2 [Bagarius yarrelli]|uniref:Zinc finger HIT domain-containing protein 2 n=1 Tax=Bagarius yarrelli TaxID=175774 RepID=A0A556VVG4_BAGYA|nr:Zinc finger HIT domain-containing protein 2 [Bagarius yarrelli]